MSDAGPIKVLGISGSLRKASFNTLALRAAVELAPAGLAVTPYDIAAIPLYNDDVRLAGYPPEVQAFRDAIAASDALLLVSPEYNYSISGVLKNAIDWASRPPSQPFDGKAAAIMGVSGGLLGTARGQPHIRQILTSVNAYTVNLPQVFIGGAATKFDADGKLTDQAARDFIGQLLTNLRDLAIKLRR